MKKLMIAAAIVCAAAFAQAASIDWKVTAKSPAEGAYTGYNAYVFTDATWAGLLAEGITSTDFSGYSDKSALYANGSSGKGDNKQFKFDTKNDSTIGGLRAVSGFSGETVDLVAVIANDEGYAAFDFTAATRDDMGAATSPSELSYTTEQITAAWQTVAVPEPTSGLLLLLGVAGLALRRRRA